MISGYVVDIEADDLYLQSSVIWTVWLKDLLDENKKLLLNPFKDGECFKKFEDWHNSYDNPVVAGHYILGYDMFVLKKLLGVDFSVGPDSLFGKKCTFVDTLYLSQYVDPDMIGHSLEDWGVRLGINKIDFFEESIKAGIIPQDSEKGQEFKQHSHLMDVYCERDCDVNKKTFFRLWESFTGFYKFEGQNIPDHYKCGQKSFFLMSCQEFSGWKFDLELAKDLSVKIAAMMEEIEKQVLPKLPPRKLKKGEEKEYMMPKNPFKKDGTYSHHMLKFIEKHKGLVHDHGIDFYGKIYQVESQQVLDVTLPMEIKDSDELKDWFRENGWVPTLYNYQRGPDGKPMRDARGKLIPTSPKIQEAGKICPNLEKLDGELPKQIVRFLSLRNRLSVLTGWMNNWRLAFDGRIGASRTGITPTHRQKHSVIVNIPKGSEKVLLGKEFRSLWIVEPENVLVSVDMSGLEGRVEGSYTFKYDGGRRANIILNGDLHSRNAKLFYPKETVNFDPDSPDFNKDDPLFKPYRDRSKNGAYALAYGCSPSKLASTLGKPESEAKKLYDAFWDGNPALKALKEAVEKFWETQGQKKWLPAIDGRRLLTRKKSALINTIFQSCGAIAMDYAICFVDEKLGGIRFDSKFKPTYNYKGYEVKRLGYMHDQIDFECHPDIAQEVKEIIERAFEKSGEHLKLKVSLKGDGKIGKNLYEVH